MLRFPKAKNLKQIPRLLRWFYSLRRDCMVEELTPIIVLLWFRILRQVAGGRWKGNVCLEALW